MGREDCGPQGQECDDNAVEHHPGKEKPNIVLQDGDEHQEVGQEHERDSEQDDLNDPGVDGRRLGLLLALVLLENGGKISGKLFRDLTTYPEDIPGPGEAFYADTADDDLNEGEDGDGGADLKLLAPHQVVQLRGHWGGRPGHLAGLHIADRVHNQGDGAHLCMHPPTHTRAGFRTSRSALLRSINQLMNLARACTYTYDIRRTPKTCCFPSRRRSDWWVGL